jgi:two-component system response regulator AtoC
LVNLLFIDDDPAAHETLKLILPDFYVVQPAYTARQGVEAVGRDAPDVVLLDVNLPDMDGLRALRLIASRPAAPPVVMLTGSRKGQ